MAGCGAAGGISSVASGRGSWDSNESQRRRRSCVLDHIIGATRTGSRVVWTMGCRLSRTGNEDGDFFPLSLRQAKPLGEEHSDQKNRCLDKTGAFPGSSLRLGWLSRSWRNTVQAATTLSGTSTDGRTGHRESGMACTIGRTVVVDSAGKTEREAETASAVYFLPMEADKVAAPVQCDRAGEV